MTTTIKNQPNKQKTPQKITSIGKDVEKLKHLLVGTQNGVITMEDNRAVSQKAKNKIPYDPPIPLLG